MAAGDLITMDYQFEYNGLLMGDGTIYDITGVDGMDLMAVRQADEKRPYDHGAIDLSPDLLPNRVIILRADVISPQPSDLIFFRTATAIRNHAQTQLLPLVWQLPGQGKKMCMARVRNRAFPIDRNFALGFGNVTLQFWAPDPFVYDNNQKSVVVTSPIVVTGFGFPIAFPLTFGGDLGGSSIADLTNLGDIYTYPTATIYGPIVNPTLSNTTYGQDWHLNMTLSAGDVLVVDFKERTAVLNISQSVYSYIDATSIWWHLMPGTNEIRLSGGGVGGSAQVVWRDAWHAAV
jgi:hypothetical protein